MSLELWNKVEKTDPNYTKKANVKGNNITSIAPQYQIKQATEQFGSYGKAWGFEKLHFDYSLMEKGMVVLHAMFFYPDGKFPIINSVQINKDNAQTKIDDDFAKKVETDTLTKALSKLGFSADIFLGKFDDIKYFQEVTEQFKTKPEYVLTPETKEKMRAIIASGDKKPEIIIANLEKAAIVSDSIKKEIRGL